MAKAYSNDLRERVITALQKKIPQRKVAEMFSISVESVKRWWKKFQTTNDFSPQVRVFDVSRLRVLDYEKVLQYVKANPDKTLKEIGKVFQTTDTAIFYVLKKSGFTYKKKIFIRGEGRRIKE
jgi:transposase